MERKFPDRCIINVYYIKGISRRKLFKKETFSVVGSSKNPNRIIIEKRGEKLRLLNVVGTRFGSYEHLVDDAVKYLDEEPRVLRQVLTVAGIGSYDNVYKYCNVHPIGNCSKTSIYERKSAKYDSPLREGLINLPIKYLKDTIAVYRSVATDWNKKDLDDSPTYDDVYQKLYILFPYYDYRGQMTPQDWKLCKELAEKGDAIAMYALAKQYETVNFELEKEWIQKAADNGNKEAQRCLQNWLEAELDDEFDEEY